MNHPCPGCRIAAIVAQTDAEFRPWLLAKFNDHDTRAARYWELVAIMKGHSPQASPNREWTWIVDAMKHHLAD